MIPARVLRDRVTIYFRALESGSGAMTGRYGDPILDEDEGTEVRALMQPISEVELLRDGDETQSRYRLFLAPVENIDFLSRIVWRDRSFEVLGEPAIFTRGYRVSHYELQVREVTGG